MKGDSQADIDIRALSEKCHRLEYENQRLRALLTENGIDLPVGPAEAKPQTPSVKAIFNAPGDTDTAITVTPSNPLKSFWQPAYTPPGPEDNGFGIGVDPSNFGVNISNESNLFHEALHGYTNLVDQELYSPVLPGVGPPSVNISIYIKNNVLSKCPSFR